MTALASSAAPGVPSGLLASSLSATSFTLKWNASSGSPVGYNLFRGGTQIGTSTSLTFNITGLTPSTTYSMTVKSRDSGGNLSAASTALSVKTLAVTSAPTFSPIAGTYTSVQTVTITSATSGASIHYTTDGSTPTATTGIVYSAPVSIAATATLKAIASHSGNADSTVTSGTYTINFPTASAPVFSPAAGTYTSVQTVTIASATSGASIRYTTDGSTPTATTGTVYSAPVSIAATATLKAIASHSGNADSTVTSGTYTINLPTAAAPVFNPVSGTYTTVQTVTITTSTSGASIRYTTDGTTPSATTGTLYSAALNVAASATLKAIAYKTGYNNSAVSTATYTVSLPTAVAPTFTPAPGTYTAIQTIAITSGTTGASIRYTTNGTTPTSTAGTVYSSPISISTTSTLRAIAYKSGFNASTISTGSYTVNLPTALTPTFTPAAGTYTGALAVAITAPTSGSTIRYTTDGSTPSQTNGTLYSRPVDVFATTTLNAIAYETGYLDSRVFAGAYTLNLPPSKATLSVLYNFTPSNSGGINPTANLIQGTDGSFYGTTTGGTSVPGSNGTVFKITPGGVFTPLVSFSGDNGADPVAALTQGADGNFYGTTQRGGTAGGGGVGTIFKMSPTGSLTTLVVFGNNTASFPSSRLLLATDGNFYGTTIAGSRADPYGEDGTVFKVTPGGALTIMASLYDPFNYGAKPQAGLVQGVDGNFYGTTELAGEDGCGTIFSMTPDGFVSNLVSFSADDPGAYPLADLVQGRDGNFYGTTNSGGSSGHGNIFKMTPAGVFTQLASFDDANGGHPNSSLVQGRNGNFYGTASAGGSGGYGTIFEMTPMGALTTLVTFNGTNGSAPEAGLVLGTDGNLYGTTYSGGTANSGVIFQLVLSSAVAPTFSPTPGTYNTNAQTVAITSASPGALIRYTTDGSMPSETNGTLYSGPISVFGTVRLQAIAYTSTLDDSTITIGDYMVGTQAAAPTFTPSGGTFTNAQTVSTSSATTGASIVYTTDGSTPTQSGGLIVNGTLYTAPFVVLGASTTLQAVAFKTGFSDSLVTTALYTNTSPPPAAPVFSIGEGIRSGTQMVAITNAGSSSVYYTLDGSVPNLSSSLYVAPITITRTATLRAFAVNSTGSSTVTTALYTILPVASAPSFSLAPGNYASAQNISINSATAGATIIYTIDGSLPSETNGTMYSGLVAVSSSTILKAISYSSGSFGDSDITQGFYAIGAAVPTLSVLHSFAVPATEGNVPGGNLVQGTDGYFYGTTLTGGSSNVGAIFKVSSSGVLTSLASFNGTNGRAPGTGVVQGADGNFYGTTGQGGASDKGTVFRVTPSGAITTLVSFTGANGRQPGAGLAIGSDGNLYGTTCYGGNYDHGTVFKITPSGSFTSLSLFDGSNGSYPRATLLAASDGNFYGTTSQGGSSGYGTVFQLTPSGTVTTLTSFNGSNGRAPQSPLCQGTDGNFYGTTLIGGDNSGGTAFRITAAGVLTTLVSFSNDTGVYPTGLLLGSDGLFYGLAQFAGPATYGSAFKLNSAGTLTVLTSFDSLNGANPAAGLIQGRDGNLYGTTSYGGDSYGVFFQLLTPGNAIPVFSPTSGTYTATQVVSVTTSTSGATIRYTTDGSTPSHSNGVVYSGPLAISTPSLLQAIAYSAGGADSPIVSVTYTIILPVAAPVFNPAPGIYTSIETVSITTTAPGATIRYTLDGSPPSITNGAIYSGPMTVSATSSLKAIAYKANCSDSPITSAAYTISIRQTVAPPVFRPTAGTHAVTISCATAGSAIRYTTDGSNPSAAVGTVYSGPVLITGSMTLKAVAYQSGFDDSTVTSVTITVPTITITAPANGSTISN